MSSASSSVFFNYTVFDRCAVFLIKIATFAFQLFFVIGSHEHDSHILIASLVTDIINSTVYVSNPYMRMLRSNETSIFIWTPNYIQVDYEDYVTFIPSFFILYVGHSYADC